MLPKSLIIRQNPSTAPGKVTASIPRSGTAMSPFSRRAAAFAAFGARPDPFKATTSEVEFF